MKTYGSYARGIGLGIALLAWACARAQGEPEPAGDVGTTTKMVEGGTAPELGTGGTTATEDATDTAGDAATHHPTPIPDFGTPEPKSCALAAIDPSADPAAVIDAGDGKGQIPTRVGEALLRNCGCHYTDDVQPGRYIDYKSNDQPMSTLADFHGDFKGTFPAEFETRPTFEAVAERVVHLEPLPMPPYECDVEGSDATISAADLELFTHWLAAGAPDGASYR